MPKVSWHNFTLILTCNDMSKSILKKISKHPNNIALSQFKTI